MVFVGITCFNGEGKEENWNYAEYSSKNMVF